MARFGDLVYRANTKEDRFNTDKKYYVGGEHIQSSELLVREKGVIEGSTIGPMFYCGFSEGDVLFVTRNPHLKKSAQVTFDGICSEKTLVIRSKDENILLQSYLPIILQTNEFWDYCEENKSGGVNYFINWSTLAEYEFDLPTIEVQKSLSDKVWAAYRLKEAYKRLLTATDEMVKSQFLEMFGNPFEDDNNRVTLSSLCLVNPPKPKGLSNVFSVSFVPMDKVNEDGTYSIFDDRPISEVKKGFTYFAENDVLFAKITPCMENGKGAIMRGLTNKLGFGSTEFHALRPIEGKTTSTWLFHLTMMDLFRKDASKNMTGTGGQKRVPASYLENFLVQIPSIEMQAQFETIARQADKSKFDGFKSQFLEMFGNPVTNPKCWPSEQIKDVAPESPAQIKPIGKTWLLNLDMIEPQTGEIIEKVYEEAKDTLSVQPFDSGNVLFSKLRPYLNKVVAPDETGMATTELVPLRPKVSKLNKIFLVNLLRSNQFVSFANEISGGTKMPRMPLSELRKFKCILPPMELQTQFEAIYRQADKSKYYELNQNNIWHTLTKKIL